jgi:shikimate kinase
MVSASGLLVYLKSPPEKLFHRLRNKINRPLLFDAQGAKLGEEDLKDRVFALYGHREVLYERADITVLNGEQPVGLTVDEIVRKISRHRV